MVDRKILKQLMTELRNTDKADYKGYTIVKQPTRGYWIGTMVVTEGKHDVVFHTSCQSVVECIKWIDAETEER